MSDPYVWMFVAGLVTGGWVGFFAGAIACWAVRVKAINKP